jgi:NAD(P)-dependent dehydrogenase (short-subunit alcohol dehydrogenase family)
MVERESRQLGQQAAAAGRGGKPDRVPEARNVGLGVDRVARVAVVFGASRGIGQRIAQALEASGMVVAPVARTSPRFRADVSCAADVLRVKAEIEAAMGTPTVLVNAAGVFGPISLIKDGDPDEWIRTLMINTVGAYLTCRAFVGGMIDAGWGRIVNVSSAASLHTPGPLNSAYATSKVALNQFTRHLAAELEGTGVTANVIHPGEVKTEMWADIRDKAALFHALDGGSDPWVTLVDETGGDPPAKAAKLVLDVIGSDVSGSFLWIDDPLQAPIPSWGAGGEGR